MRVGKMKRGGGITQPNLTRAIILFNLCVTGTFFLLEPAQDTTLFLGFLLLFLHLLELFYLLFSCFFAAFTFTLKKKTKHIFFASFSCLVSCLSALLHFCVCCVPFLFLFLSLLSSPFAVVSGLPTIPYLQFQLPSLQKRRCSISFFASFFTFSFSVSAFQILKNYVFVFPSFPVVPIFLLFCIFLRC